MSTKRSQVNVGRKSRYAKKTRLHWSIEHVSQFIEHAFSKRRGLQFNVKWFLRELTNQTQLFQEIRSFWGQIHKMPHFIFIAGQDGFRQIVPASLRFLKYLVDTPPSCIQRALVGHKMFCPPCGHRETEKKGRQCCPYDCTDRNLPQSSVPVIRLPETFLSL